MLLKYSLRKFIAVNMNSIQFRIINQVYLQDKTNIYESKMLLESYLQDFGFSFPFFNKASLKVDPPHHGGGSLLPQ